MLLSHPRPTFKEETKPESILSSPIELNAKSTNTNLVWEYLKTGSHWVPAAKLGGFKAADDVLQGGSHHKVLLLQAQLLPLKELQKQNSSITNPDTEADTGPQRPPATQDRYQAEGRRHPAPGTAEMCVWVKREPLRA